MPGDTIAALLEFLYLTPVGIVKFRPDGAIEMANPMAAQLLMPLSFDGNMTNLYRALSNVSPDLPGHIVRFQEPCGQLWDQMRLAVPGTRTVLTLSINKINPDTFMAVIQDISRTIEQEIRIRDDERRFRAIFENIRDYAIYTVDSFGRIDGWNQTLGRIGGWEASDANGSPIGISFPAELQAESTDLLDRARKFGTAEFEGWRVRRDGSRFWGHTVATALPDADGGVSGYVLVTRDQTERKRMEDRLVALSTTDPLTGAFNRRAGDTKLEEAYRDWRRDGRIFSLLMIDCDHFKKINDRWGHGMGDKVLITLVRICKEKLRNHDAIFRWGGEEFLVLLPGANSNIALDLAERLRLAIAAACIGSDERQTRITVSIGVVEVTELDSSADDPVRRVDRALYQGKAAGRNRVVGG